MSQTYGIGAVIAVAAIIFLAGWALFHFGLFPNLVVLLAHVHWITMNAVSANALYWTIVFAWLLGAFTGTKTKLKA